MSRLRGLVKMCVLPIRRNIHKFNFTREDTLADKVVVHLNVLSPGMEYRVLR